MEQQEQRDKLQVLHSGQEQLRRNINRARRSYDDRQTKDREGIATGQAKKKLAATETS